MMPSLHTTAPWRMTGTVDSSVPRSGPAACEPTATTVGLRIAPEPALSVAVLLMFAPAPTDEHGVGRASHGRSADEAVRRSAREGARALLGWRGDAKAISPPSYSASRAPEQCRRTAPVDSDPWIPRPW